MIFIGLMLGIVMGAMDSTIVAVALPSIVDEYGQATLVPWVVSGYMVAMAVATPVFGKLGDQFGRTQLYLGTLACFVMASVASALAQTLPQLISARVVQGICGGGLMTLVLSITGEVAAPRERGRYQVYLSLATVTANALGPVLGGLLVEHVSWRAIFWINLPLGIAAGLIAWSALRHLPVRRRESRVDVQGALLLSAGLTCVLGAMSQLRADADIPILVKLAWFAAGAALLVAFAWVERRAAEPILHLRMLKHPDLISCVGLAFIAGFNAIAIIALSPLRDKLILGGGADESALHLIPLSVGISIGSWVAGRVLAHTGRYKPQQCVAATVMPIAITGLAVIPVENSAGTAMCMLMIGGSAGILLPTALIAAQNAAAHRYLGMVTGIVTLFRHIGGAVGATVLGAMLLGQLASIADAPRDLQATRAIFTQVFLLGAAIALLGPWFAFRQKERPLRETAGESAR